MLFNNTRTGSSTETRGETEKPPTDNTTAVHSAATARRSKRVTRHVDPISITIDLVTNRDIRYYY